MDQQIELFRLFRQQQEKYVYYIIALCVTAIGFSVYKTTGIKLNWTQIPLAFSVTCWGLSIFYGLQFLKHTMSYLRANNALFNIIQGIEPGVGTHPQKMDAAYSGVQQAMEATSEKCSTHFRWQERLFYLGIILFLLWHVMEMYRLTQSQASMI